MITQYRLACLIYGFTFEEQYSIRDSKMNDKALERVLNQLPIPEATRLNIEQQLNAESAQITVSWEARGGTSHLQITAI